MGGGHGIVGTLGKAWLYPTIGFCMVGAIGTAAAWSDLFTNGVGAGVGIAVTDAPNLGDSFRRGQEAAGGADTGTPTPEVAEAAPASD